MTKLDFVLKSWRPYGWICFVGLCLYWKSSHFNLTYFDDQVWVKDLLWYIGNPHNIWNIFKEHDIVSAVYYRPIIFFKFYD